MSSRHTGLAARGLATVDVQDLPGDGGRGLQEQDGVHDVADLADLPERGKPVTEPLARFHGRVRVAWSNP